MPFPSQNTALMKAVGTLFNTTYFELPWIQVHVTGLRNHIWKLSEESGTILNRSRDACNLWQLSDLKIIASSWNDFGREYCHFFLVQHHHQSYNGYYPSWQYWVEVMNLIGIKAAFMESAFTCSHSLIATLEPSVNYVQNW